MSKEKKPGPGDARRDHFGLNEPTGQFDDLDAEMKRRSAEVEPESLQPESYDSSDDVSYKLMGWKGINQDEEVFEQDVAFEKKAIPEDELDMTPMVDVTFLLLIFFMVTASFTLQKSLEQPHAQSDQPSTEVQDNEIVDDYVQVTIDQTNTYYVTTRDAEEIECPSDSEMRSHVTDAKKSTSATRLIIVAHVDSTHSKVVTAWDAGVATGMEQIEIQTTDEEF